MSRKKKESSKMSLSQVASSLPIYYPKIVNSNIAVLDNILKGGFELGSIVQLVSESGMGKSTIAMQIAKSLCEQDYNLLYLDCEGSISRELMESTGVKEYLNKRFFYVKESTFNQVEKTLDKFINTDEISFVIVDSIAGIINEAFINLDKTISITTNNTGYSSRPLVLFMQKYNSIAKTKNICFILTNQYRNKVDMQIGTILKEYGAKGVKYNSDVILRIAPLKATKENEHFRNLTKNIPYGRNLEFEIVKSNKRKPEEKFPFYFFYGQGISTMFSFIEMLINKGIIQEKANAYYSFQIDGQTISAHGVMDLKEKVNEYGLFDKYSEIYINDSLETSNETSED